MEFQNPFEQTSGPCRGPPCLTRPNDIQPSPNMFEIAFQQNVIDSELALVEPNQFYYDYDMTAVQSDWADVVVDPRTGHTVAQMHATFEPLNAGEHVDEAALVSSPLILPKPKGLASNAEVIIPERGTVRRIRRSIPACIFCADRKAKCDEDPVQCGQCRIRSVDCVRPSKSPISPTSKSTATEMRRGSIATAQTGDSDVLKPRPQRRSKRTDTLRKKQRPSMLDLKPQPSTPSMSASSPSDIVSPRSESSAVVSFHNQEKLLDLLTNETAGTAQNVLLRLRQTKDVVKTIEDFGEGKIDKVKLPTLRPTGLSLKHLPKLSLPIVPGMVAGMGTPDFDFNEFLNGSPQVGSLACPQYAFFGRTSLTPNYLNDF